MFFSGVHKIEEVTMERVRVDVIIPTYHPDEEFGMVLERLEKQSCPVHRILVMNTEQAFWKPEWEAFPRVEVHHLKKEEFDHGGTRKRAAALSDADIMVFMTQDALPADKKLIENLVRPILENEEVKASYARQIPKEGCCFAERYTRTFNYPARSSVKGIDDLPVYGIKTYFCSNVCAAYDRTAYIKLDGFVDHAIFNEDMIYAGKLVQSGGKIAYAADARVFHSHDYSCMQQFHRNFDLGVSQADHPEIFRNVLSEGEGIRLVKKTAGYLIKSGHFWLIPNLILSSACKYAGYFLGKRYMKLPKKVISRCTMNKGYWEKTPDIDF